MIWGVGFGRRPFCYYGILVRAFLVRVTKPGREHEELHRHGERDKPEELRKRGALHTHRRRYIRSYIR